ncbi:methyltransferase [Micromonospora sp. HM5-17]|jgi:Methylase involved in ubiquinone/menaquinone biosynthesis|uniref:methyltransferase n=1 Tax=Micromonospora sp. HM5-17 TaxID=2487710 RepID=UPI000F475B1F|nr:methyltransferase [Micromonospora sp. HM5-17]ROT33859.1 methyltransferase [Micromonospora sp. HM5-17]
MNSAHPEPPADPDLGAIMAIATGHWQTKILVTAVEADLFTNLSGSSATIPELSERLGYRMPGAKGFFLALVGLGLLESHDGRLRNSATAEQFLVRGRPQYIGGYLQFCARELNPAWDGLAVALRTGQPQNRAAIEGNPYDSLYRDEAATEAFLDSMDMFNTPIGLHVSSLDWSPYSSVVDVGGARGNLAHTLVTRNPHLTAIVFDLPQLESAFTRHMAALGGTDAVSFVGGDFFTDPLPEADVLIFGHILHNWSEEHRIKLLQNAYQAVRPGGAVLVYDPMVDGANPPFNAVLASLSMLVWSAGGSEYSVEECHGWLTKVGFRPETVAPAGMPDDVLVIGHKDR